MTRSEYERACYLIGVKPIDIPDEILDEITEQQLTSLFYNPDNLKNLQNCKIKKNKKENLFFLNNT